MRQHAVTPSRARHLTHILSELHPDIFLSQDQKNLLRLRFRGSGTLWVLGRLVCSPVHFETFSSENGLICTEIGRKRTKRS